MSRNQDGLDSNWYDRIISIAKVTVGASSNVVASANSDLSAAASIGGAALIEFLSSLPHQRLDRIVLVLRKTVEKIDQLEISQEELRARLYTPEFADLLEDALIQGARVITEERQNYLAAMIVNGLTRDDIELLQKKRLFSLLSELNDAEIIILRSYALHGQAAYDYREQHKDILNPYLEWGNTTMSDKRQVEFVQSYRQHLYQLGLISRRYRTKGRARAEGGHSSMEVDAETGMPKVVGENLSLLGSALLHSIDLLPTKQQS